MLAGVGAAACRRSPATLLLRGPDQDHDSHLAVSPHFDRLLESEYPRNPRFTYTSSGRIENRPSQGTFAYKRRQMEATTHSHDHHELPTSGRNTPGTGHPGRPLTLCSERRPDERSGQELERRSIARRSERDPRVSDRSVPGEPPLLRCGFPRRGL
jgi:hypothetical protein